MVTLIHAPETDATSLQGERTKNKDPKLWPITFMSLTLECPPLLQMLRELRKTRNMYWLFVLEVAVS